MERREGDSFSTTQSGWLTDLIYLLAHFFPTGSCLVFPLTRSVMISRISFWQRSTACRT
jgi:hypothetical protein